MKGFCSFIMLLGRLCLSAAFLWGGFYKIFEFHTSIESFQELTGFAKDAATWIVIVSLIVEIIFGILLAIGWLTRFSAFVLAVYTACMILLLYQFWTIEGGADQNLALMQFLRGVGIIGGLLYVIGTGAGCCSCDGACKAKSTSV